MDQLQALRLFVRLSEKGTFSAAASDLKIKQSTASKWIAELETELGASLVERTTRSVRITDVGNRVLDHARQVLSSFDGMKEELAAEHVEPNGRVRISVPLVLGRLFVLPALTTFLKRYPRVGADLVFEDRYVNLVEERFDLAIRVGVPADTTARARKIADTRRVLVAAPSYVAAHGRPSSPRDLAKHECLVHGASNASTVWRFGRGEGDAPVRARGRLASTSTEAILAMAKAGFGIALLADWLVDAELARGHLVELLAEFSRPKASVQLLLPPGKFTNATVSAMAEHLVRAIAARLA